MSDGYCAGCDPDVLGAAHTCAASGVHVAEEAYAAGAVSDVEELPLNLCELRFTVRGDQQHVDRVLLELSAEIMARADVQRVGATILHDAAELV